MAETAVVEQTQEQDAEQSTSTIQDWRSSLPEDFRGDPALAQFKDVSGLAKSYIETKKMSGVRTDEQLKQYVDAQLKRDGVIKMPGEKATPDEVAAFHKALGVPDAPTGYEIKRPEIAMTVGWNEENEAQFKVMAHRIGLTPKQAQAIVDFQGERIASERSNVTRNRDAVKGELRTLWGSDYEAHVGRANRAVQTYGGEELINLLSAPSLVPLGDHPVLVRTFAKIAADLIEHEALPATGTEAVTPDEATQRIAELRQDLAKVSQDSPQARDIREKIIALTRALTPRR